MATFNFSLPIRHSLAYIATMLMLFGCGGGTTGTSSTGELNLQGRVEQISDGPISGANMVVFSADTNVELIASRTDSEGRFNMALPGSEAAVVVELDGERLTPIQRKFSESSVLTTVIVKQSKPNNNPSIGEPSRRFFDVQYTFELHIRETSLCPALSTNNNVLYIEQEIETSPCSIEIEAFSKELGNETFYAELIGICDGNTRPISLTNASSTGSMIVDIADARKQGCSSLRISAYSVQASDTRIVFPIIDSTIP